MFNKVISVSVESFASDEIRSTGGIGCDLIQTFEALRIREITIPLSLEAHVLHEPISSKSLLYIG